MAGVFHATFDRPDETRPFNDGKGRVDLVNTGSGVVGRATFEPGWRWSVHAKPNAGTDTCQAHHIGYVVSGHMTIHLADGIETQIGPGELTDIPPGHDAWVDGDEPVVLVDWAAFA